ncbi:MAG: o-succinylbenzoate synthase [Bacteroidales bacterium]|jgi:o-succinylbenzoate synthase|nr:o-succinylbenzoate synthase [Bacteroidales bacterium]
MKSRYFSDGDGIYTAGIGEYKWTFWPYELSFRRPVRTSRGGYTVRGGWYLRAEHGGHSGTGEVAPLPDLSPETPEQVQTLLRRICNREQPLTMDELPSSVRFGMECAALNLRNGGALLFPSAFTDGKEGIATNGLIWMDTPQRQQAQAAAKLEEGFRCVKLKIGALQFEDDLRMLEFIRRRSPDVIIRVDANGAFPPEAALGKLRRLADFHIHSIEQPIAAGQWPQMRRLCAESPIPIALDEELIGVAAKEQKEQLLEAVRPQYLVLKPSLHGGLSGSEEWIALARQYGAGWWITSALETNIGLTALAQWTYIMNSSLHQGLGTGQLFVGNPPSPLELRGERLWYNPEKQCGWDITN